MNKRLISLFLTFVMIVTLLPQMVVEASVVHSGTCGENLTWTIDDVGTLSISGNGEMYDYSSFESPWSSNSNDIRAVVISYGTTSIGGCAFEECSNLISVTIPDSVTSIGNGAFSRCWNLTDIHIPNSVISIGKHAFSECNFNSIVIPNGVNCIAYGAFMNCSNLSDIIIPSSVTSIGECSFYGCFSLDNVIIPNNVMSIGNSAFHSCSSLTNITIPNTVSTIERYAFIFCDSLTDVYYTDTEEQWNIIDIEDTNGPLLNATIHFESTVQSDNNFAGNYNEFMQQKAYQVYWDSSTYGHNSPTQYAFIDLDKDDNKELIICSDSDFGFNSFLVFDYHENLNQVTMVPVMGTGYEITSFYGGLEYSDQYAALVFTETNDGSAFGGLSYYSINDGKLSSSFHIGYENYDGSGAKYYTSTEKNISEEQYFEYIFESVAIEFYPITDFVPMDILEKTNEHYARTEWIEQHMEYAASDEYQSEIVGGYSDRMLAVFRDALDDEDISSYETRKAVSSILNLDFELSEADMYELILAEILYGENGQSVTEEAYAQNLEKTIANMTKVLVNIATTGDSAKDIPEDTLKSIKELYELLQTLELGSEEYSTTYGKFISLIKGNVADVKSKVKTELAGDAAFTGLGIVIDGAFEQYEALEDILNYLNNYVAYQSTSRQTHDVLEKLFVVLYKHQGLAGVDEFIDELGLWDSMINWSDFQLATVSVMEAMVKYEQEGAAAVAAYAVDREREATSKFGQKALKSVTVFAIEKAASCVPVINAILLAKNIVSVAVSASVILDQIFTNVDEREYALDILTKSYVISVMLDKTVDDCADVMKEDDFYSTTVFDRSVFMYKQNLLNAFGYAVKYADMVLANAEEELREYDKNTNNGKNEGLLDYLLNSREKLIQAVSWYTNSLAILKEQQVDIESIACHDSDLYYDPLTDEIIYNFKDSRIYIVACPVSVVVKNEAGEQIACLSGESDQVAEGYGFYFHTIKVTADSDEYIKVAIVPDNYQIELVGTDDGTMNAFVADFTTDEVGEVETYFNVPVKKNSVGSFETATDGSDSTALVMDEVVYFNMESIEDIPAETNGNNQWIWILGGVAVTVIALFLLLRKKNHKA